MNSTVTNGVSNPVPAKRDLDQQVKFEHREDKTPRTADILLEEQLEEQLPDGITETNEELQKHWFVGSIDQGTTSTRFLIFNGHGEPVASHQIEFENKYPESGYAFPIPASLLFF
jgi:glycerol kinase